MNCRTCGASSPANCEMEEPACAFDPGGMAFTEGMKMMTKVFHCPRQPGCGCPEGAVASDCPAALTAAPTPGSDGWITPRLHVPVPDKDAIIAELCEALEALVDAKALKGVRGVVAGWNGENLPDGRRYERHPDKLGASLPKTNCGAVYDLDDAMQRARAALSRAKGESK